MKERTAVLVYAVVPTLTVAILLFANLTLNQLKQWMQK